jgi:hypothetical protein
MVNIVVTLLGDISRNGNIPMIDITLKVKNQDGLAVTKLLKESTLANKDADIAALKADVETKVAIANADVTLSGGVQINDIVLVAQAFGKTTGSSGYNSRYDMDKDGTIDIRDIAYVALKVLSK